MIKSHSIDNSEDLIDSREVIARIAELESDRETLVEAVSQAAEDHGADSEAVAAAQLTLDEWDHGDEAEELTALRALQDAAEGYCPDWPYGATLIHESYFETYARDMAEDLHGSVMRNAQWPFDCIDWERAAEALKIDYTAVEFGDATYWVR
jgi:hypothetical protein